MSVPKIVICLSAVAKKKDAERLARLFLKKRLAACVKLVPGSVSHYRWKGKLFRESEILIVIKTVPSLVKRLEKALKAAHPYELPEFVVIPVRGGAADYLEWVDQNATGSSDS